MPIEFPRFSAPNTLRGFRARVADAACALHFALAHSSTATARWFACNEVYIEFLKISRSVVVVNAMIAACYTPALQKHRVIRALLPWLIRTRRVLQS